MRRLTRAAAHSTLRLITETAALTQGWAALVDLLSGTADASPQSSEADAVRAAANPQAHPHLTVHTVPGAFLVMSPGSRSPAHVSLIARVATDLLRLQARQADEAFARELRIHTAAIRFLIHGEPRLAHELLGSAHATHATVFRFTGGPLQGVQRVLWRSARSADSDVHLLTHLEDGLAVVALSTDHKNHLPLLTRVARVADQHQLTGGAAGPVTLDNFAHAWAEAGSTRASTAVSCLLTATGLGERGLLHTLPPERLNTWASSVLHPLSQEQRRTLEAWLRTGSTQAASRSLHISDNTLRARLRAISPKLGAELNSPTVRAQLLLALRAPNPAEQSPPLPLTLEPALPERLLDPDAARRWATELLGPLSSQLRAALRCWLGHHGRAAPAATALGLHRTTLSAWLEEASTHLLLDLSSTTVRSELHLALETLATRDHVLPTLVRRGGRTYQQAVVTSSPGQPN